MPQEIYTNNNAIGGDTLKQELSRQIRGANKLQIATGYFGSSAISDFEPALVKLAQRGNCQILVGMVYHSGVTAKQKETLTALDTRLRAIKPESGVFISRSEYHGKIYSFKNENNETTGLFLGSSNFSNAGIEKRNECTARIESDSMRVEVDEYLDFLFKPSISLPLRKVDLKIRGRSEASVRPSRLLSDYRIARQDFPIEEQALGRCEIELRVDNQPASSLNLYFDKGRKNATSGLYSPRPWYEVEITADKTARESEFYPRSTRLDPIKKARNGEFVAYAQDGEEYYKFQMKVYSDDGKAIATSDESGGRQTLGKFIKGKLQAAGVLREGERVTSDVLEAYGRTNIEFLKMADGVYILKF